MKVLVACEFSGTVRDQFIALGHDAVSCDLIPTECPGPHIQGDVLEILDGGWDLMIAHPPCTYLANSGVSWLHRQEGRWELMEQAALFFKSLIDAPIPRIAVENPIMHSYGKVIIGQNYSQIIQPYQFGHPESKATCLWLKELPRLVPTYVLDKPDRGYWDNQTPSGQNKLGPSEHRAKTRGVTYVGIARAMAQQWST